MNKREIQKEETIAEILKSSENLFREIGYEKTTIQMIADRCGLSKGALYHHFKSKEEVLEQISNNYYLSAVSLFLPIVEAPDQSMKEKLHTIMTMARQSLMNTAASTFVKGDGQGAKSVDNALMEKMFNRDSERIYRKIFAPLLEQGRSAGECDYPGSAEVLAGFIHHLDTGMTVQLNEILSRADDPAAEEEIRDIVNGFSYSLSRLLNMDKSIIDEITLTDEMLKQYQMILSERIGDSEK